MLPITTQAVRDAEEAESAIAAATATAAPALRSVGGWTPRSAQGDSDGGSARRTLLELLPPDTIVIEEAAGPDRDEVQRAWNEAAAPSRRGAPAGRGGPGTGGHPRGARAVEPAAGGVPAAAPARRAGGPAGRLLPAGEGGSRPQPAARRCSRGTPPTLILCDNEGQLERLEELLDEGARGTVATPRWRSARSTAGSSMPTLRVLTDHEIFRRARRLRRPRRYRQAAPSAATGALTRRRLRRAPRPRDRHLSRHRHHHGRGSPPSRWPSSNTRAATGSTSRSTGSTSWSAIARPGEDGDRPPPQLHRLGGSSWQRVRDKTRTAIQQMAAELLDLYARRSVTGGYAFPPDTRWQRELESSVPVRGHARPAERHRRRSRRDMEQPRPMDRLLVGDVGYGKTEIAVRAAFKAVQGGKQVAVLVPTTILAEQHGRTFIERLADFPVKIEVLSRFRTAKEQKAALDAAGGGRDRHRHRHPPAALEGRAVQGSRACSWWTRSTASASSTRSGSRRSG